ncbi:CopM family metallochaperone [Ancylobacter mangrovi]|uniref:CopM family metallochaperone n=1 Tax=Ancylobacter mangrovi TaxID=2972472 RepID=UPI002161D734|nr:DUF305 domain-containing protein [Ancylobacter mangrovi]MCS0504409.1 DUF305 domain-containing protein [Ancylobacter mangrovi]
MRTLITAALGAAAILALPTLAAAQSSPMPMDPGTMKHGTMEPGTMGHDMSMPGSAASGSTRAFEEANERMHHDMGIEYSGNADVDFVRGMIPHHMGAVEMARVELQFGKDPELRKLAEDIIAAQEKEIAFMKGWLAGNAK